MSLTAVRAREPAALALFFDAYFDRVYGLAYRLVGHRALAEDLTQDTFLRVQRALDTLDPTLEPWPWIARILVNACRDHWGAAATRHGREALPFDEHHEDLELAAEGAGPEDAAARRQEARLVQQAIDQLPPPGRLVVLLHDYRGLSHDEIAEVTGDTHAAVRQQYRRALQRLGKLLRGRWN